MPEERAIDRLIRYLTDKGIRPSIAEKELSLANGYIKNTSKPERSGSIGSDILSKITDTYLDLCLNWLITGKGGMLTVDTYTNAHTPDTSSHFSVITHSNTDKNTALKDPTTVSPTVSATVSPTYNFGLPQVVTVNTSDMNTISLVGIKARGGYLNGYGDPEWIERLPSYCLPGLHHGTYRAFEIEGDSMKPTLKRGDIVFGEWVESLDHIRDERIHVVVTKNDGIVIKRLLNRVNQYGFIIGKSDNIENRDDYPNLNILPSDILEVWYPRLYMSADFKAPGDVYRRISDLEAGLHFLLQKAKSEG